MFVHLLLTSLIQGRRGGAYPVSDRLLVHQRTWEVVQPEQSEFFLSGRNLLTPLGPTESVNIVVVGAAL